MYTAEHQLLIKYQLSACQHDVFLLLITEVRCYCGVNFFNCAYLLVNLLAFRHTGILGYVTAPYKLSYYYST